MGLKRTKRNWDDLAELDTYWAILGYPDLRSGKWVEREFFDTGEREIAKLMSVASELGYLPRRERALDFGCGVGRLTRTLAGTFAEVCGVDISSEMISRAMTLNSDRPNCRFIQNDKADLRIFADGEFDLIYTVLVLQHQPSRRAACKLIGEFLRTLRSGGLLMFQIPTYLPIERRIQPRRRLYGFLRGIGVDRKILFERLRLAPVGLIAVPETNIRNVLDAAGGRILRIEPGDFYLAQGAETRNYWVTK